MVCACQVFALAPKSSPLILSFAQLKKVPKGTFLTTKQLVLPNLDVCAHSVSRTVFRSRRYGLAVSHRKLTAVPEMAVLRRVLRVNWRALNTGLTCTPEALSQHCRGYSDNCEPPSLRLILRFAIVVCLCVFM